MFTERTKTSRTLDPERCQTWVPGDGMVMRFHQCARKPWKDGKCKQHHHDAKIAAVYRRYAILDAERTVLHAAEAWFPSQQPERLRLMNRLIYAIDEWLKLKERR